MERFLFRDSVRKIGIVKVRHVNIDGLVFRLHYKVTTVALIALSMLVTGYQFFGKPIMCLQKDDVPERLLNTFCWAESTFSLPKAYNHTIGKQSIYPGVAKYEEGDDVIEHAYYQWVCFILILQAAFFMAPRIIWQSSEKNRVSRLLQELDKPLFCKGECAETRKKRICSYLIETKNTHAGYARNYFFCEILNFVNVVGQIYFTNTFLGGAFSNFGAKVVQYAYSDQDQRFDPMIHAFPRISKCFFHKFGSSGDVQKHDALCLLPLNIVNEKIYIVLYFWFLVLAILSALSLVYYSAQMQSSRLRILLLRLQIGLSSDVRAKEVVNKLPPSAWFLLYMLGDNMERYRFKEILKKLEESEKVIKTWASEVDIEENRKC